MGQAHECPRLSATIPVGREHQFMRVARLERRVTGVRHDAQFRFGPRAMQIPGAHRRADDIVASLNDGRRNVPDAHHIVEQLAFAAQETAIHEVMALDARHGQSELILAPFLDVIAVAVQETGGGLPDRPGTRGRERGALIAAGEPLMVGAQKVIALVEGDRVAVGLPRVGKYVRGAVLIEPADFGVPQQENSAQYDFADALGVGLRIGQGQRAAPGSAEYQPALDPKMLAQSFDVRDQMPGRVLDQARARAAAAAAALVEHDDAVMTRVEKLPRALVGAGAGSAVQEHGRLARRVAAFFIVNLMDVRDAQVAVPKGLERRIQFAANGIAWTQAGCSTRLLRACRGFCRAYFEFFLGRRALRLGPARCGARLDRRVLLLLHRFSSSFDTYARETMGPSGLPPSRCTCR